MAVDEEGIAKARIGSGRMYKIVGFIALAIGALAAAGGAVAPGGALLALGASIVAVGFWVGLFGMLERRLMDIEWEIVGIAREGGVQRMPASLDAAGPVDQSATQTPR